MDPRRALVVAVALRRGGRVSRWLREARCRDHYDAHRWSDAATTCLAAGRDHGRPDLLVLAARATQLAGKLDAALAIAEQVCGTAVDAMMRENAGGIWETRDDHARAEQLLGEALAKHSAELNLAAGERELGHLDEAQRHLDALNPDTRGDPLAGYVAGLLAVDRGDAEKAERLFAAAAKAAPDNDWDIAYHRAVHFYYQRAA